MFIGVIAVGLAIGFLMPGPGPKTAAPADPGGVVYSPQTKAKASAKGAAKKGNGFSTFIDRSSDGHFYATVQVNNFPVRFMIDTGATSVALTRADAERVGLNIDPAQIGVIGRGASGNVSGIQVTLDSLDLEGKRATNVQGSVITDGLDVSLLGQSFLSQLASVNISGDRMEIK